MVIFSAEHIFNYFKIDPTNIRKIVYGVSHLLTERKQFFFFKFKFQIDSASTQIVK